MAAIHTDASRARSQRPTKHGMHPAVAERLASFGIDPEERSREIALVHGRRPARKVPLGARASEFAANAGVGGVRIEEFTLDPNDVRVTPLLNQAAMRYEDNQYIADIVAPVQLTSERSAKYKIWDRGPFRQLIDSKIGPQGSAKEVSPTLSEDNYSVVRRALKSFANDDTDKANPSLQAGLMSVEQVMELHATLREREIATQFSTAANYPVANVKTLTAGGGGTNWKQGSAAKPISDMLTLMEAIPGDITHAVLSDLVWHATQQNAAIAAILASQFENKGLLRPMDFSLYFGIPNVLITKADYRDAAGARKRLWSETGLWMGSVNAGRDRRTFCRTFRLSQGAGGFVTKRWRDEDRGENGGVWVRTAYSEDRKIVSSDYGAIIELVIG